MNSFGVTSPPHQNLCIKFLFQYRYYEQLLTLLKLLRGYVPYSCDCIPALQQMQENNPFLPFYALVSESSDSKLSHLA